MIGDGSMGPEAGDPYGHPDCRHGITPRRQVDARATHAAFYGFLAGCVAGLCIIVAAAVVANVN